MGTGESRHLSSGEQVSEAAERGRGVQWPELRVDLEQDSPSPSLLPIQVQSRTEGQGQAKPNAAKFCSLSMLP